MTEQGSGSQICLHLHNLVHLMITLLNIPGYFTPGFGNNWYLGIPICGFPKSICTSVNDVVCHGIPSDDEVLVIGDLINVDVTVITSSGWHGDTSKMWLVGLEVSVSSKARLAVVAREALYLGISACSAGGTVGSIGKAVSSHAHEHGYSVVREYSGHGIGLRFHEGPRVLHHYPLSKGEDTTLEEGMVITIEPMINEGGREVVVMEDQWTVVTRDGGGSAQWEHTVVVRGEGEGCEILSMREGEVWPVRVKRMLEKGGGGGE
ncbi:hypothetical protein TrCOL_g1787 [Triparma columacea]|uniref:Methionine aminopeptidase n=1 Tax=Triparma columacea TaxID=722753 RepID=A0A9W7G9Q7_9STRA|nr:hypothetical protein TrCOL_g1787 [Triparma columacea]